jgi:hypothetical protein
MHAQKKIYFQFLFFYVDKVIQLLIANIEGQCSRICRIYTHIPNYDVSNQRYVLLEFAVVVNDHWNETLNPSVLFMWESVHRIKLVHRAMMRYSVLRTIWISHTNLLQIPSNTTTDHYLHSLKSLNKRSTVATESSYVSKVHQQSQSGSEVKSIIVSNKSKQIYSHRDHGQVFNWKKSERDKSELLIKILAYFKDFS